MKRRELLASMGAALGTAGLANLGLAGTEPPGSQLLTIQNASFVLRWQPTRNMVSLSADAPPPVLFARQGVPVVLDVHNTLDEYTAMHWHGIRVPNDMDGVPYLTQFPIAGGETYRYGFTPPDAGTYWYHPHCMTMTQMAHGLTGVLVVREAEDPGFDADQVINLRDFRLDESDAFLDAYTLGGAARAGTLGNVMTANWLHAPVYDQPAGGLVRLRLANTDTTRIYRLTLTGAEARIIAWDGHPLSGPAELPGAAEPLALAPGQRVDIAVAVPAGEGREVFLKTRMGTGDKTMATLRAVGTGPARSLAELKPLPANPIPEPNLATAQTHEFVFGWSPEGTVPNDGLCGSLGATFWSINRVPWAGDNAPGTEPLAELDHGKSYILRLRNESPNRHPVHLHGLVFRPLRSNKRTLAPYWTDTVLLLKDETIDIALVADNPGDWAFHCHVIEHQKTGLAGFIRVT